MIREAIATLVRGNSLSMAEASIVMQEIMEGQATPSQLGAFVTALSIKGETMDEIAGLAKTMRAKALHVDYSGEMIDIVGTGGDRAGTFNISTTAAFVVAGAGLKVAKHGNRARYQDRPHPPTGGRFPARSWYWLYVCPGFSSCHETRCWHQTRNRHTDSIQRTGSAH
jgi:hypothetical protein